MYVQLYINARKEVVRATKVVIFLSFIFPIHVTEPKKRYPFLHKMLSLLTEQDEFDIVLAIEPRLSRLVLVLNVQKVPLSSSYMPSFNPVLHAYIVAGVRMF